MEPSSITGKWHYSQTGQNTKIMLSFINSKSLKQFLNYTKPLISYLINSITGHGSFRTHLNRMQLADERCCLYCGASEETNIHFLLDCTRFSNIRNQTLGFQSKLIKDHTKNNTRINMANLSAFIRKTGRFEQ